MRRRLRVLDVPRLRDPRQRAAHRGRRRGRGHPRQGLRRAQDEPPRLPGDDREEGEIECEITRESLDAFYNEHPQEKDPANRIDSLRLSIAHGAGSSSSSSLSLTSRFAFACDCRSSATAAPARWNALRAATVKDAAASCAGRVLKNGDDVLSRRLPADRDQEEREGGQEEHQAVDDALHEDAEHWTQG